jgi:hypothetical protein
MHKAAIILLGVATAVAVCTPAFAEPKVERKVNCVYPGETLGSALADFAGQLGFTFVPGEMEDGMELDELIWVHARGITADSACVLIGASGGVRVKLDETNRQVTVAEPDEVLPEVARVSAFKVDALCRQFIEYQNRYGVADDPNSGDEVYRPTASEELRDAIAEILQLDGAVGSAVGKRIVYTRGESELARIAELLKLLETHGESDALRLDREHRGKLGALKSDFRGGEMLVSAMLWQVFKDCDAPVYIDSSLMASLDLQFDLTNVGLIREQTHYDALLALAREQGFWIDSRNGALRLHEDVFEGASGYRVFDVSALLVELEKEYAELKTTKAHEGFQGDLRSEGGVQVIVAALALQLENAGYSPLIRAFGSRIVMVGGVEIVDRTAEILTAIGWTQEKK